MSCQKKRDHQGRNDIRHSELARHQRDAVSLVIRIQQVYGADDIEQPEGRGRQFAASIANASKARIAVARSP